MTVRDPLAVLRRSPLFEDVPPAALGPVIDGLARRSAGSGEALMTEGDEATWFAIVLSGAADVQVGGEDGVRTVGRVTPGAILGELALLAGQPRMATVVATEPMAFLAGDAGAFGELLALPGFGEAVARLVAQRLARIARRVEITLSHGTSPDGTSPDGTRLALRPILPTDGAAIAEAYGHLSAESRRRRFFTAVRLTESLLRYLVDVDYVDHFAWVATEVAHDDAVVGVARYVRDRDHRERAELAVTVMDAMQGHGLGRVMVSALAAAAWAGGIEQFTAEVMVDNQLMRGLLTSMGARWTPPSAGVVSATIEVADLRRATTLERWAELHAVASGIITTAGLVLADPLP